MIALLVPGKYFIILHIINIKMNGIAWNIIFPKRSRHFRHILQGHITPSGLLISQCPLLRQRTSSCQISITFQNFRQGISPDIIVVQIAVIRAEPIVIHRFLTHIEITFKRIVQEQAINIFSCQCHKKRN